MTQSFLHSDRIPGGCSFSEISRRRFLKTLGASGALLAFHPKRLQAAGLLKLPAPLSAPCLVRQQTTYPPMLARFIAKLDPASDVFLIEVYAEQIRRVFDRWKDALCCSTPNSQIIQSDLTEDFHACSLTPNTTTALRSTGSLCVERRTFAEIDESDAIGRDSFLSEWRRYLNGWAALETVELEIYGIRVTAQSPLKVETDVRYDFVGLRQDGNREQRVGAWHLSWIGEDAEPTGQQPWKIERWSADSETRSWLIGPGFIDITGSSLAAGTEGMAQLAAGIDYWRTVLDGASGIDVYGNHGIAAGDIDGSGYDSFYICQPSGLPNRLYRNRGDGTFEDITEISGTGILDNTGSAIFADFQNRGMQDLLVLRTDGPLLFVNLGGGRFKPQHDAFRFARPPMGTFTSASVADYDRDGFLDVYLCSYSYYQGLNQYQFPSPYYDAQNGPPNFLFRNKGDGTFEDVTVSSGMDQNNNRFSFAAAWCDYDNDGWPDLYVANDFGRKNLYRNHGDVTFTDVAANAGVEDYGPGMSACWLDYDNDGLQDVYVANMWLPEGKRITTDSHFLPDVDPAVRALYQKHNAGNSLYRNGGAKSFEDKSDEAGSAMGRWSWSCASWDFDNDGWPDLYVANGFVSGPNRYDLQSFFWRQVAQQSMSSSGPSPDYELAWNAINELVRSDYSWSGYQRNVFFVNNRDGTFADVSGVLGLDLKDDCRAFALSDFDHDGRPEFVLKNRTGPQLKLLRNNLEEVGNSIALRLTGSRSNRDAVGSVVILEGGASRQTKFVSAGSGFASQHTKELFFGVGESSGPISVSVRWPTGAIEHFSNLPVNHRVEITEGQKATIVTPYKERRAGGAVSAPEVTIPDLPERVSTWLVAPLSGPDVQLRDLRGEERRLSSLRGQPVLLTFLRANCGDSLKQLDALQRGSAEMLHAGLALFVVALTEGDDRAAVEQMAGSVRLTIPLYTANEQEAGAWNIQYRYLFDRRRNMPLPTSFLLDERGDAVCVYQGLIAPQAVMRDWKSAPLSPEARFARALPFRGPYYGGGMKHNYLTYGIAFLEYGYLDEAQSAFQRAVETEPGSEMGWFNLGTIYLNRKMYSEARDALSRALQLNPQDSDAWNNLGMVSGEEQKYDEALDQFHRAASINPNNSPAIENMMRLYQFRGQAVEAQKTLKDLIALAPANAQLHLGLGMALVAQNDMEGARAELETSVRLKPDYPEALNDLGVVLLRLGKTEDALNRFEQSSRLAPDFDRPCINAALIYSSQGQAGKARALLEAFLTRHPGNADVRHAMNRLETP